MSKFFNLLLGLTLSLCCLSALALPSDRQQVLTASSNTAEFQQQKNLSIYEGNVIANQGSTHLRADKLTIQMSAGNQVQSAVANGNPATFITKTKPNKPELIATAKQIEYQPPQHLVVLTGDAFVKQGENTYKANVVQYNTESQTVSSPTVKNNRATIVIQP